MKHFNAMRGQRGVVTIFVSMIMLLMITLLVITAYSLSMMNMRAAGNVQVREEALAAANVQINRIIDSEFWKATGASEDNEVDLNGDGVADFLVDVALPRCVRASKLPGTPSGVGSPGLTSQTAWNTIWELDATATAESMSTRVRVLQGVRVILSTTLTNEKC